MPTSDPLVIVRYLDVLVIVLATPFIILTGAPVLGFAAGGGVWIVTRYIGTRVERYAISKRDPRASAGISLAMLMGRAWVLGITILVVGIAGSRKDGLTAALLALVVFTIYFTTTLLLRPFERTTPKP